ncbi:DUF1152 domain-containing protein [Actinokineospora sp. 24-640]
MGRTLMVAAGGGGDAIAAAMLAPEGDELFIATWAWERLSIDPLPGPRGFNDFTGLRQHGPLVFEVTKNTKPRPPSRSTLPRLAETLPARVFLLDAAGGARGTAQQISCIAAYVRADCINLVDVGGDLVATGDEQELRSPLADSLALAACSESGVPFYVTICGPGLDGELPESVVSELCQKLEGGDAAHITREIAASVRGVFDWHPSEVTALLVSAALGARGVVEIRDNGSAVPLSNASGTAICLDGERLQRHNQISDGLCGTKSLTEVEEVIKGIRGSTEIDFERDKSIRKSHVRTVGTTMEAVQNQLSKAALRGVDFLTSRRVAELISTEVLDVVDPLQVAQLLTASKIPLWPVLEVTPR